MLRAGSLKTNKEPPAMTRPPGQDDQPPGRGHLQPSGKGQLRYASGEGHPGNDPVEAQRVRLASFWALVLRRFRGYVQRSGAVADRDRQQEGR
jgi:hypothetical protein